MRQFGDKLVSEDDKHSLEQIFTSVLNREFNIHFGVESLKGVVLFPLINDNKTLAYFIFRKSIKQKNF